MKGVSITPTRIPPRENLAMTYDGLFQFISRYVKQYTRTKHRCIPEDSQMMLRKFLSNLLISLSIT
jgi:hypothetical protein